MGNTPNISAVDSGSSTDPNVNPTVGTPSAIIPLEDIKTTLTSTGQAITVDNKVSQEVSIQGDGSQAIITTEKSASIRGYQLEPSQINDIINGNNYSGTFLARVVTKKTASMAFTTESTNEDSFQSLYNNMVSIGKDGRARIMFQVSSGDNSGKFNDRFYSKFFTEAIDFASNEKIQLTETLANYVVSFRGAPPMILNVRGSLLNDTTNEWLSQFLNFYETYRATAASQKTTLLNREVTLEFEKNFRFTGYIISFGVSIDAVSNPRVPFTLSMLVKSKEVPRLEEVTSTTEKVWDPALKRWISNAR